MSEQPPHLRAVQPGEEASAELPKAEPAAWAQAAAPARRSGTPTGVAVVLGVCLLIALALLMWSRTRLNQRIGQLQDQVIMLQTEAVQREAVIDAHRERIDDVRRSVEQLQGLLAEPLPE